MSIFLAFKSRLSHLEQNLGIIVSEADSIAVNTLHDIKSIKFGFYDDHASYGKSRTYWLRIPSLDFCTIQPIVLIKPSKVKREFDYISGHIVELLSCCHPELLIKWCENLTLSETNEIEFLPLYSVCKLKKLRTSSAVLKMMSTFWSWSNHSILEHLAEISEIAAALIKDFDSRLYLNSLIIKYPIPLPDPLMIPHNNNSFTVLTVKCNRKLQVTLQEVYDIQSMIIEKCEITQHALQLLAVQSSPLILQWMISKYIVTVIYKNVRKHHNYFATKGITEILIHPNIKHCIDGDVNEKPILLDEVFV